MQFCELVEAVRRNPLDVTITPDWGQGRASFGGLMVALQYEAMRAQVPAGRALRSLAVTFVGPAEPDVSISFEVEVLREGKAVSQVLGRAVQNGQVVTLVQGSFGAPRESVINLEGVPAPQIKAPEDSPLLPYIKGVTPEFMRHMSMAWPPALLPLLNKPTAGSTLTWTIEFVQPLPQVSTLEWCQYLAVIEHARDGYGHVAANLWAPNGELVAISRQTVAVFG